MKQALVISVDDAEKLQYVYSALDKGLGAGDANTIILEESSNQVIVVPGPLGVEKLSKKISDLGFQAKTVEMSNLNVDEKGSLEKFGGSFPAQANSSFPEKSVAMQRADKYGDAKALQMAYELATSKPADFHEFVTQEVAVKRELAQLQKYRRAIKSGNYSGISDRELKMLYNWLIKTGSPIQVGSLEGELSRRGMANVVTSAKERLKR
jgi:hypothetical protein